MLPGLAHALLLLDDLDHERIFLWKESEKRKFFATITEKSRQSLLLAEVVMVGEEGEKKYTEMLDVCSVV